MRDDTRTQKLVIAEMTAGEWIFPMGTIAENLGIKRTCVVRAVRGLRRMGLAELSQCFSYDDGGVVGSGYILTPAGVTARNLVAAENEVPHAD